MTVFQLILKYTIYIICFLLSMMSMRAFDYERFLKQGHVAEAQTLYFLLVMALAYLSGSFVCLILGIQ